jgi:hypothetical protein
MAFIRFRKLIKSFTPAAVGTTETKQMFNVEIGDRVHWLSVVPLVNAAAGTSSTINIGDDGDTDRFLKSANYDLETAVVGTPIAGAGDGFAPSGGHLYTAANTIDALYTNGGATGTRPKFRVIAIISNDLR